MRFHITSEDKADASKTNLDYNKLSIIMYNVWWWLWVFALVIDLIDFWCFSATFSSISAISWRPGLVVEEAGVAGENHRPLATNW